MTKKQLHSIAGICILGTLILTASFSKPTPVAEEPISNALITLPLKHNAVQSNPYFGSTESSIHNDIYGSDVTAYTMPLGIHTEIQEGTSDERSLNSPPAFFYDTNGNAIAPYTQVQDDGSILSGGVAILDMDSDETLTVLGSYMPESPAGGIQISYSFVNGYNYLVGPTVNGHVKFIETTDENGNVLEDFNLILDIDVLTTVQKVLSATSLNPNGIDTNLLSITYDYDGNVWFTSGGFLMDPTNPDAKQGFCGYIACEYIENNYGKDIPDDPSDYIHVMAYDTPTTITNDGAESTLYAENCENGIVAHPEGCVILTNRQCYLFQADKTTDNGIAVKWSVPYKSVGRKVAEDDGTEDGSGAGLAWGGGSSPTLTNDLALFTDNLDVINLYAVNIKTGEIETQSPILDFGETVAVENSICVYSGDENTTSIMVCNWLGAGKNYIKDSSVQKYDVLYDNDWRALGSDYLTPGIQRIDILKNDTGYTSEIIWSRDDLKDTSMMKLSTGSGYYYGYTQDLETDEWGFFALDFNTGETVFWIPVSDDPIYNNIAIGIMQGTTGNVIYCPTNSKTLLSIRDRFVYLPESPDVELDITKMKRELVAADTIPGETVVTPLLSATISQKNSTPVAFRVNGLCATASSYNVYLKTEQGYEAIDAIITDEKGVEINNNKQLNANVIYEVRLDIDTLDNSEISILLTSDM